jgi:hypothetical protein
MDTSLLESLVEFPIDYTGQALVERFSFGIVVAGTLLSLLFAFALQDIVFFLYAFTPFIIIASLVCLPAYSKYNQNPTIFLKRPAPKNIQIELD